MSNRVFIVDDHPVVRFGLAALLREEGFDPCGEAENASGALAGLPGAAADLVIVDISLGGASGLALIKDIKIHWPKLPLLALSMRDEILFAERALAAGAIGYLSKTTTHSFLIEGVRRALRGELVISAAVTNLLLRRGGRKRASGDPPTSPVALLSDRELEIIELMGQGKGTRAIAEVLHISVKTVETHQGHMKAKLGARNGSELVRFALSWSAEPDQR